MLKKKINVIDLFAGIGGFHLAFDKKYINVVLASDINKFAIEVYKKNYNIDSNINVKDIDEEILSKLPNKIDFLTAGFPCQSFSIAGKKGGFDDPRGKLIFSVLKIVQILKKLNKKPKILLLENVKYLTKINNGKIFEKIKQIFENENYITLEEPLIISPHDLGIPQHRPRIIIPFILYRNFFIKSFSKFLYSFNQTIYNIQYIIYCIF